MSLSVTPADHPLRDERDTTRRAFVGRLAGLGAAAAILPLAAPQHVRAVVFDAFAIFDPRSVAARAEDVFPGRGAELTALWRTRQFEYSWLRVVANDYADFWRCTEDALVFAAASLRLDLTADRQEHLMAGYDALQPWPDVQIAVDTLRAAGIAIGLLSNFTPRMLDAALRASRLRESFSHVLSTHAARTFKPDPRAYALGTRALGMAREAIVFVAFAGWDAAGARRFGYPTFWANRLNAPPEKLGAAPNAVGASLDDLPAFVADAR